MTTVVSTPAVAPLSRPVRKSRRFRIAAVVSCAVAALIAVAWWWTHPSALPESGPTIGSYNRVGTDVYAGVVGPITDGEPGSVTIISAQPRITEYVSGAVVRVLVCHDGAVGVVRGIERYCSPVEPASGATMQVGLGAGDAIVVHVRSPAPGVVRVEGVDVTYASGWQRGTQTAGGTFEATFGKQTVQEYLRDR